MVTTPGTRVDLNADVGEGCGQDAALMPLISSANIACGGHAGDADSMREAVALAIAHGVAIGAHPSFPDREHFGRQEMHLGARDLHECMVAQIESLANVAAAAGTRLRHVKPHGALYNMAARDEALAETVVAAGHAADPSLMLFALAGSTLLTVAERHGLRAISETFADRRYRPDGSLVPRNEPGSLIQHGWRAAYQAMKMARDGEVLVGPRRYVAVRAETICVHGDTPGAVALAQRIRYVFNLSGITVAAPEERR